MSLLLVATLMASAVGRASSFVVGGRRIDVRCGAAVESMSYRELQAECKARGVKATGATAVLRERLLDLLAEEEERDDSTSSVEMTTEEEEKALWEALGIVEEGGEEERTEAAIEESQLIEDVFGQGREIEKAREELRHVSSRSISIGEVVDVWKDLCSLTTPLESDGLKVLGALARLGAADEAREVVEDVERVRGKMTGEEWKLVYAAHARVKKSSEVDSLLSESRKKGLFPDNPDGGLLRAILKACVGARSWRRAIAVVKDMHDREDVYATAHDWDLAFFAIQRRCVDSGRTGMDKFKNRARYLAKQKQLGQLLREVEKNPAILVPDAEARAGVDLLRLVEQDYGVVPSLRAFDATIASTRHAARPELALELLRTITSRFRHTEDPLVVETRHRAYTNALGALKRAAFLVMQVDERDRKDPFVVSRRRQLAAAAVRLVEKMIEDGDDDDELCVEEALVVACSACSDCYEADAAAHLLAVAKKRAAVKPEAAWPTIKVYNAVLSAYETSERSDDASRLLAELDPNLFDAATYNICLKVCAKKGEFAKAEGVLDEMTKAGTRPDVYSYSTAIRACCTVAQQYQQNAHRRNRRNNTPPPGKGRVETALRVLELALANNCANHVTVRTTFRACVGAPADPLPLPADAEHAMAVVELVDRYNMPLPDLDDETMNRVRETAKRGGSRSGPLDFDDFSHAADVFFEEDRRRRSSNNARGGGGSFGTPRRPRRQESREGEEQQDARSY